MRSVDRALMTGLMVRQIYSPIYRNILRSSYLIFVPTGDRIGTVNIGNTENAP